MAIRIFDTPEPMSERSLHPRDEERTVPLLVEADAGRLLKQELRRYCEGQITGRSFLIAGHRGAGKTTLVAKAFLDVWLDSEQARRLARPLFIPLHGPNLFPPRRGTATPPVAADPFASLAQNASVNPAPQAAKPEAARAGKAGARGTRLARTEARIALEQITLGLHRAVAKEFARRFYERVAAPERSKWLPTGPISAEGELYELAAQFETELYEGTTPQRLREFWARAGATPGGVLFRELRAPRAGLPEPGSAIPFGSSGDDPQSHGQAARELVALSGVLEAYRRISGEYRRSEGRRDETKIRTQRAAKLGLAGKEAVAATAALVVGALTGAGFAAAGTHPLTSVGTAIAAALGASVVLKASSTRTRDRSSAREDQFIFDLSVSTLDRALPILIERLRHAGLAPVFVVDELDKVQVLGERIVSMVHHLKKLVAENAFFCFLVNRSYYEEVLARAAGAAYPIEYTYYTHRLFVAFAPEDFERYLRLRIPDPPSPPPAATAQPGPADEKAGAEAKARAILRWVLRHRAQLHVVDLQREIAAMRGDDGDVAMDPKVILSLRRNVIDVTEQVAIELRLEQQDVREVTASRPEFRRLLHDALYYLSREWLDGEACVNLDSVAGRRRFVEYLERRTGRAEEKTPTAGAPAVNVHETSPAGGISSKDVDYLLDQVRSLADFLSDRDPPYPGESSAPSANPRDWRRELLAEWRKARVDRGLPDLEAPVSDALLIGTPASFLVSEGGRYVYRFRYRVASAALEPVRPESWRPHADFAESFARALKQVLSDAGQAETTDAVNLNTLADPFNVIPGSPPWSVVESAIRRLRDAGVRGAAYAMQEDDVFSLQQFRALLERNSSRIALALACASALGSAIPGPKSGGERLAGALALVSRVYQLEQKNEDEVGKTLARVAGGLAELGVAVPESPVLVMSPYDPGVHGRDLSQYKDALVAAMQVARLRVGEDAMEREAWSRFRGRLDRAWFTPSASNSRTPSIQELIAAATKRGPETVFHSLRIPSTSYEWVRLLTAIRAPTPGVPAAPAWLGLYALHALGVRAQSPEIQSEITEWLRVSHSGEPSSEGASAGHEQLWNESLKGPVLRGDTPEAIAVIASLQWVLDLKPTAKCAVLPGYLDEIRKLFEDNPPGWVQRFSTRILVLAGDTDANTFNKLLPALKKGLGTAIVIHHYLNEQPEMRRPFVVGFARVQVLIDAALTNREPLTELTPPSPTEPAKNA